MQALSVPTLPRETYMRKEATTMRIRMIAMLLVLALVFTAGACSFGDETEQSSPDYIEQIVNPDRSLFYGETITIATSWVPIMNEFAFRYMEANPGVRIDLISYFEAAGGVAGHSDPYDFSQPRLEIGTQLMAGSAPTLIDAVLADPFDPRQAIYFFDLYLLMDTDPNFNEEDWFMNVFHAFSINDQLFHFPFQMIYTPVVANSTISGLLEAMSDKRQGVTMSDLMELHRDFSINHPHLLEEYFTSEMLLQYYIGRFVDVETGRVDFGEEFIDLITYAESITCPDFTRRWRNTTFQANSEIRKSERYLFHFYSTWQYHHFHDQDGERPFASITPLVNGRGEMLIDSNFSFNYLLNANATPIQKAIAWDFLMFVMQHENQATRSHIMMPVPNRNTFYNMAREMILGLHEEQILHTWFPGTSEEHAADVIGTMTKFQEMPLRSISVLPRMINEIIEENMTLFHDGLLSAEQVAQNLQDQITLALMEMDLG